MAEPAVNTMSEPNIKRIATAGTSQNFLRTLKNPQMSLKNSINAPHQYGL